MRPQPNEHVEYYAKYIALVPDGDIVETARATFDETLVTLNAIDEERAKFAYAPGKWSIKNVVVHLADAERIFAYRALRIARKDATPLASFDENTYANESGADQRKFGDLVRELRAVRAATLELWQGFPEEAWPRIGTANHNPISVRALAYITVGHELHHRAILVDRYLGQGK